MPNYPIFISYRRDGGEHFAGRIADRLRGKGYQLFFDRMTMRTGSFPNQIQEAVTGCQDFILILSPGCLDRCQEKKDWVRKEIELALQNPNRNIIPVWMKDFVMPGNLPETLRALLDYHGLMENREDFDGFIDRLLGNLESKPTGQAQEIQDAIQKSIRYIRYKQYPMALNQLQSVMQMEPANPDVYFYSAIATLGGKRPFLVSKAVVNQALEQLSMAALIEDRGIYHSLMAYIKLDHHDKKMLRVTPDYCTELATAQALGVDAQQLGALFALMNVEKPAGF